MILKINNVKPLSKTDKKGRVVNLFGNDEYVKDLKNVFGDNYKNTILNKIYFLFTKNINGEIHFNVKEQAQNMNISKNPRSYRKQNLKRKLTKKDQLIDPTISNLDIYNSKTLKEIVNFKDAVNNNNMLVIGNEDIIKKISPNVIYDVSFIKINVEINISDGTFWRHIIISKFTLNEWKQQILNYPVNKGLKPAEIKEIITGRLIGDNYFTGLNGKIPGYLTTFPGHFHGQLDYNFQVHLDNGGMTQTLKRDGANYYLYNDIHKYTDMNNFFSSIYINIPENKNCVIETLKYIYDNFIIIRKKNLKLFYKELKILETLYINNNIIPTYKKLIEFLEITQTNYKIFNFINNTDTSSNIFKPKEKIFNFIVYNQHLYLIDNETEFNNIKNSLDANDKLVILTDNLFDIKFNNIVNDNKKPKILKMNKNNISLSGDILVFEDNKKVYIKDDENKTQTNLLYLCQVFNIKYEPLFMTESNFINFVLKSDKISDTKSFYLYNHTSTEILYSEDVKDYENTLTFDFNKYYSNILLSLDKIPIINILCNNALKYDKGDEIDNNYIYSIKILDNRYNLWFPNDDIYFGSILNTAYFKPIVDKMLKNNELVIIDKISCEWIKNYYQPIIKKLFNVIEKTDNNNNISKTIKNIINRTIGKFNNCKPDIMENINNIHIEKDDEIVNYNYTCNENFYNYQINDNKFKLFFDIEYKKNNSFNVLENHKPLRTLIINLSRLNIIKFILDNNIDEKDIIQINTDSITVRNFKKKPNKNNKKQKFYLEDEIYYNGKYENLRMKIINEQDKYLLYNVKIQDYKKYSNTDNIKPNNISFVNDTIKHNNKFIINLGFAGVGKSFKINEIIQEIVVKKEKYILLAPLHKVLKLYNYDINKQTIQYYTRNNKIPEEQNVIIDEFYLINFKDFRYIINWLYSHNKTIYLYGDIYQLPPVDIISNSDIKPLLNIEFLESISTIFTAYDDKDKNHRNNFLFDVYREFIKNEYTQSEQINIINYFINDRCDETKPFKIICYKNETKDRINNEYLTINNQIFYKDDKTNEIIIKGLNIPLICKKNIKINENITICAKDEYFLNVKNNKYILSLENIKNFVEFELEPEKIYKLFDVAYCLNLYNIQGQTLPNYKFILDDVYFLNNTNKFNITGGFYTLLSRITEKITDKKITINDINIIKNKTPTPKPNVLNDINISTNYNFGKKNKIKYSKNNLISNIDEYKPKKNNLTFNIDEYI